MEVMEGEKLISEKLSFKWGRCGKWEWKSLKVKVRMKKFEGENENKEGNL